MSEKNLLGKKFDTFCIHAGHERDEQRAHLTPIYASSTYTMDNADYGVELFTGQRKAHVYGRFGNPNTQEVEHKIAALEAYNIKNPDGTPLELKAILHASGMGAISTGILSNVKSGEKILSHYSLYGGTQELFDKTLPNFGISYVLHNLKNADELEQIFIENKELKLLYLESPANPSLNCVDIEMLCALAHKYQVKVLCDNTFATPYLQQPFALGADFVVHSTTKYLNGHGTAVGGILLGKDVNFMNTVVTKQHRLLGANANAFDAFLLTQGIKTLALRMEKHCSNAEKLAAFFATHNKIEKVNYLGLASHPDYALAQKQMKHPGAMMSIVLKGNFNTAKQFIDHLQLSTHAVSLGTLDTLVSHPASTTHFGVPEQIKIASGINDTLVRISVGLENIEDLMLDFKTALEACTI